MRALILAALAASCLAGPPAASQGARKADLPLAVFHALLDGDEAKAQAALKRIGDNWQDAHAAILLEVIGFLPSRRVQSGVVALLEKASGRPFGGELNGWYHWLWSIEPGAHPDYAEFKATLY